MASNKRRHYRTSNATGGSLYFAFGSNLDRRQMRRRCPNAITIGPARLNGFRLAFCGASRSRGAGVANVEKHPDTSTIGVVYWLPESDLRILDRCEGHPWWYRRETMTVRLTEQGRQVRAFVYVLRGQPYNPPTAEYYSLIARAYDLHGFKADGLHSAVARCFRDGKPVASPKPVTPPAHVVKARKANGSKPKKKNGRKVNGRKVNGRKASRPVQASFGFRTSRPSWTGPPRFNPPPPPTDPDESGPPRLVFVYGTLLDGEPNSELLDGCEFIGSDRTRAHFHLADMGSFPAALEGGSTKIRGEVYEVDPLTLEELDRLEGHPKFYRRVVVTLASGRRAWIYILPTFRAVGTPTIASGDWRAWTVRSAAREAWNYEQGRAL